MRPAYRSNAGVSLTRQFSARSSLVVTYSLDRTDFVNAADPSLRNWSGLARYTCELSLALARTFPEDEYYLVSDQRLSPTFTRDLATAVIEAVDRDVTGLLHLTAAGACSWLEFTEAIYAIAGLDVAIEPVTTSPGGTDRPLNGVLESRRAEQLGLTPLRHWREALEDYMQRAGYAAGATAGGS